MSGSMQPAKVNRSCESWHNGSGGSIHPQLIAFWKVWVRCLPLTLWVCRKNASSLPEFDEYYRVAEQRASQSDTSSEAKAEAWYGGGRVTDGYGATVQADYGL